MSYQVIWDKNAGSKQGSLPTPTQGGTLETITILALYRDGTAIDLSSMTLSATMTDRDNSTTAVTGTLTGANGSFTWKFSAGDIGTSGSFSTIITYTDGAESWDSVPVTLVIVANPAASAVQNPALVGVSAAKDSWLTTALATVADAATLETTTGSQAKADAAQAAAELASLPRDGSGYMTDSLEIRKDSGGINLRKTDGSGSADISVSGDGTSFQFGGGCLPFPDNTHGLGTASQRWANCYVGAFGLFVSGKSNTNGGIDNDSFYDSKVLETASNYTIGNQESIFVDTSGGDRTITLPALSGKEGRKYYIKNAGGGIVTIDGNGSETIDGALTTTLTVQYESIILIASSTEWGIF